MTRARIDITGQRFARLIVLRMERGQPLRAWVRCDCGVEKSVLERYLRKGATKSCGCLQRGKRAARPRRVLVGERHGSLVVTERLAGGRVRAVCDCGGTWEGLYLNLSRGLTGSCGCAPKGLFSHGMSRTPVWTTWASMIQRCTNPGHVGFRSYGGRGITICNRWRESFEAFFADMGNRPSEKHSIDRIDNDKGYWCGKAECSECGPAGRALNCRWATAHEQSRNTRRTVWLVIDGRRVPACDVYRAHGVTRQTFYNRLSAGWDDVAAATTPVDPHLMERMRATRLATLAGHKMEAA